MRLIAWPQARCLQATMSTCTLPPCASRQQTSQRTLRRCGNKLHYHHMYDLGRMERAVGLQARFPCFLPCSLVRFGGSSFLGGHFTALPVEREKRKLPDQILHSSPQVQSQAYDHTRCARARRPHDRAARFQTRMDSGLLHWPRCADHRRSELQGDVLPHVQGECHVTAAMALWSRRRRVAPLDARTQPRMRRGAA